MQLEASRIEVELPNEQLFAVVEMP